MTYHTVLVAFVVEAGTMQEAQERLLPTLPRPNGLPEDDSPDWPWLDCWWVAEDERYDGSDSDSAVFVDMGAQAQASRLLFGHGMTPQCNLKRVFP